MVATTRAPCVHREPSPPPEPVEAPSSWELIAAAQGGDREAFGQLYQRYAPGVERLVWFRTFDRALAEDLTGETFARALRRVGSVSEQGRDVGAWFTTIAKNLVTDHYKSHRVQRERLTHNLAELGVVEADDPSPEQVVINRETAAQVRDAVAALSSPAQRQCIRLRFFEDRSAAATAAVMGREVGAVKALQHRAILALRTQLAEPAEDPLVRTRDAVGAAEQRAALHNQAPRVPPPRAPHPDTAEAHAVLVAAGVSPGE